MYQYGCHSRRFGTGDCCRFFGLSCAAHHQTQTQLFSPLRIGACWSYWTGIWAYAERETTGQEGVDLEKNVTYTVEREFLSEISVEELLARMIRAHWNDDAAEQGREAKTDSSSHA